MVGQGKGGSEVLGMHYSLQPLHQWAKWFSVLQLVHVCYLQGRGTTAGNDSISEVEAR